MADFKKQFHATTQDAIAAQRRIQRTLANDSYMVGLCGSTIRKGKGYDIDLLILDAAGAVLSANAVGMKLVEKHAKRVTYFEEAEYDDSSCVYMNFVDNRGFYLDIYINGRKVTARTRLARSFEADRG